MRCDVGCGECCGIVPANETEYRAVVDYAAAHGITPIAQGMKCPWYQRGRCAVHEVRPTICRLFGHTADMPCPRGYNVNVSAADEEALMRHARGDGRAVRLLHDVLRKPVGMR